MAHHASTGGKGTDGGSPPPRRGRGRPAIARSTPLERDEIVARARHIVDAEGLNALTIRRLATELGVTPMAIYHHVPDKPALLAAVIDQVWEEIFEGLDPEPDDLVEWLISVCLRTRRIWLDNVELATLAMAVAEPDERLLTSTALIAAVAEAAGFADVGLAYGSMQTYTFGSIAVAANRRMSSAYFGRDPDQVLAEAERLLDEADAGPGHRALVEARFDVGDDRNFEPGLRALVAGLRGGAR